jgi:hypothetical protein
VSYRRLGTSKAARKAHRKRAQVRKARFGGLAAFYYEDARGKSRRQLSPARNAGKLR